MKRYEFLLCAFSLLAVAGAQELSAADQAPVAQPSLWSAGVLRAATALRQYGSGMAREIRASASICSDYDMKRQALRKEVWSQLADLHLLKATGKIVVPTVTAALLAPYVRRAYAGEYPFLTRQALYDAGRRVERALPGLAQEVQACREVVAARMTEAFSMNDRSDGQRWEPYLAALCAGAGATWESAVFPFGSLPRLRCVTSATLGSALLVIGGEFARTGSVLGAGLSVSASAPLLWDSFRIANAIRSRDTSVLAFTDDARPVDERFALAELEPARAAPRPLVVPEEVLHMTPLMRAIDAGTYDEVPALIAQATDAGTLNTRDAEGDTALHYALCATDIGCEGVALQLIDAGADLTLLDSQRRSCLGCAFQSRMWAAAYQILRFLPREEGDAVTVLLPHLLVELIRGAQADDPRVGLLADALVKKIGRDVVNTIRRVDVDDDDIDIETTVMQLAAWVGQYQIVEVLCHHGIDCNVVRPNTGVTPLMEAAQADWVNEAVVRALLDGRAEVNAVDVHRETALMKAARSGCSAAFRILMQAGADTRLQNDRGETAMSIAQAQIGIRDVRNHAACTAIVGYLQVALRYNKQA